MKTPGTHFACPSCGGLTEVKDSRPLSDNSTIRRRRVCVACDSRINTIEVVVPVTTQGTPRPSDLIFRSDVLGLVSAALSRVAA